LTFSLLLIVELKVMVIPVLAKQLQSVLQDNRSGNDAGFRKIRTIIETTTNETPEISGQNTPV
jgi:hypothetical protein